MWTVLSLDVKGVYHFNPLEARQVGKLCKQHGDDDHAGDSDVSRGRTCGGARPTNFSRWTCVVTGAEKLPEDVADAFEARFGVRPVEGYGCTETSPLASVNMPPSRCPDAPHADRREGTVGRPMPGVSAKIPHLETGEELGPGQSGMLLIKGPNVMQGYLGRPDLTAEVIRDGWYVTGDVAMIDEDGFIKITGRESRFSKIGGEMVPHIQIEETLGAPDRRHRRGTAGGGDRRARSTQRRTTRGAAHAADDEPCGSVQGTGRRGLAQYLHPVAGQFRPGRRTAGPRHRQAGPAANPRKMAAGTVRQDDRAS